MTPETEATLAERVETLERQVQQLAELAAATAIELAGAAGLSPGPEEITWDTSYDWDKETPSGHEDKLPLGAWVLKDSDEVSYW